MIKKNTLVQVSMIGLNNVRSLVQISLKVSNLTISTLSIKLGLTIKIRQFSP